MADTESVEELEARYGKLVGRRDKLRQDLVTVEAELAARQRNLKKLMDECRAAGFDPDDLQEEIRKTAEVVKLKLDAFEADLEAGEKIVAPMLEEIRKG